MQGDIISIRLYAKIGSTSLSVYLDNLVPITDKIKQKFFRQKHKNLRFSLDTLFLTKNSVIIIAYVY